MGVAKGILLQLRIFMRVLSLLFDFQGGKRGISDYSMMTPRSALSPCLFALITDQLSRHIQDDIAWYVMMWMTMTLQMQLHKVFMLYQKLGNKHWSKKDLRGVGVSQSTWSIVVEGERRTKEQSPRGPGEHLYVVRHTYAKRRGGKQHTPILQTINTKPLSSRQHNIQVNTYLCIFLLKKIEFSLHIELKIKRR